MALARISLVRLRPSPLIFRISSFTVRRLHQEAPDYYTILGVTKTSSLPDIKMAYFNMAKKFHPETNKTLDARQMFSLIAEAYDVLSDEERRKKYDETGLGEERFGGRAEGPGRQTTDSSYTSEQMYDKIFGSGASQEEDHQEGECHQDFAETYAGSDTTKEYIAKITFEEAFLGTVLTVQCRHVGVCDKCQGSRSELGYTGNVCPYCEGTGQETVRTGHITARSTCSYCNGEKIFIKYKCLECEGIGRKTYDTPVRVSIPAGTVHGEVFRVETQLEGEVRVIWVTVSVEESQTWRLEDQDLVTSLELSPGLAVLGGRTVVRTPAREVEVQVETGTSSGRTIVIPEEGLRATDCLPGDLVLRTAIRVPSTLSRRQTRLIRRFASLETASVDQLVTGVSHEADHRLGVNVVEADRTTNRTVVEDPVSHSQKTITETLRDKFGIKVPVREPTHHPYHRIFGL